MKKIAKILRVILIPPVLNLVLILLSYYLNGYFHSILIPAIIINCLVPLLSYLISKISAKKNPSDRCQERHLATKFCLFGYAIGLIFMIILKRPIEENFLELTYFLSALIIFICSLINKKPSGHAAGVAGPIVYLLFTCSLYWWIIALAGLVILSGVFFSSLYLKRHTLTELITGCLIPAIILVMLFILF